MMNTNSWARIAIVLQLLVVGVATAAGGEHPVERDYVTADFAPREQTWAQADAKSAGCVSCHTASDQKTMHQNPGVILGCADCHGGNADVSVPQGSEREDPAYRAALEKAHVLPRFPQAWDFPDSANPEGSYTLLNRESPEFIRFVNPGDYRIVREACGSCHEPIIKRVETSLMTTSAMFWGGAAYNNGVLPFKNYLLGEAYTREGEPAAIQGPVKPDANMQAKGIIQQLFPLPAWETVPPADVFRVFERGGRNIGNLFPETGLPNALGQLQRLEEPGRPDIRQSNRGPGTGNRIAVPVLNMTKTRLNDPYAWFLGTNDNPGDFRSSGCSSCHVVYANDRDPRHSAGYAKFGHTGKSQSVDPTISKDDPGHPLKHEFTRAIPTAQCMVCHMHQPNIFLNSFLGYTMWDYESDAPHMWPEEQQYPSAAEIREINKRNPEEAAIRGKWGDPEFLENVSDLNQELDDTQFADYHGHGWNFRAVFKRDREGALLDAQGEIVEDDDPNKFSKAVHMSSVHVDKGMHCVDCHFEQDNHGNGHIYGEVAQAIEIDCVDCHGTSDRYPSLKTSGPAAPPGGHDLSTIRNQDGQLRFEWLGGKLIQRSAVTPGLEWEMSLVRDSVDKSSSQYNEKAARAKLMSSDTDKQNFGQGVKMADRAHKDDEMLCVTCHTSWTTSCGGCHLPIQANWKTERNHYEGGETRNYATYNPQVTRDQIFMLGKHGPAKGNRVAPVRSSSALVLSSRNANRELIYIQQPPISSSGYSSQAFAPHFPHTVRKTETKTCSDCHLSADNDNNAIMAQLLGLGTNFINFVGYFAYTGLDDGVAGVQVTEWDEPQAVIGSYLHKYAYPDWYQAHLDRGRELTTTHEHDAPDAVRCVQLRGEYLYVAQGRGGFEAYDVANIANKAFSQRIVSAPFSPLGHDAQVKTQNATCVALPTTQPIHPDRNKGDLMRKTNQEQPFHPIYNYALISDSQEGLILVDVNTLADGKPRNNHLQRALTWNENGVLDGAQHITIAGHYVYVTTTTQLVALNMDNPLQPRVMATLPLQEGRSSALQFRYLLVADKGAVKVVDVTDPAQPHFVEGAQVPVVDPQRIYIARTYAYVAAGSQGLVILNVTNPEQPSLYQTFNADGAINDAHDVVVATTNASLMAYVADGRNGLRVLQMTSPDSQPRFYGFTPAPKPQLIATGKTSKPALSLSKGLDRDRAVDETGHQMAVFGRLGSRPFNLQEMRDFYLDDSGDPWFVTDQAD